MTDWYKHFPLDTKAVEVEDEAEAEDVEDCAVVQAPPVVANGAPGAFNISPPPESGDEGE